MKKVLRSLIVASLCIIGVASANAQNRCVLKNDKGSQRVITYSDDMKAFQIDDQSVALVSMPKVKPQVVKGTSPTYTLNVYAPTGTNYTWGYMGVSDGIRIIGYLYHNPFPGSPQVLSIDLEEGIYHAFCIGNTFSNGKSISCTWLKDDIVITEDTDIFVDLDECVYELNVNLVDENGNPFVDGTELLDITYETALNWRGHSLMYNQRLAPEVYSEQMPVTRFSGFNEHSSLQLCVSLYPGFQKHYYIQCPKIMGLHESPTFVVTADELNVVQEQFIPKSIIDTLCLYRTDVMTINENASSSFLITEMVKSNLIFDPEQPYTIITNTKIENPNNFDTGLKRILFPTVYEWYDAFTYTTYYDKDYIGTPIYLDADGNVVREAKPFFKDGPESASYPNYIPETPARTVKPANKLTFFGERTPLATYYPVAFGPNNSPYGQTFFYGGFFFSGEQSCERSCDYDSNIRVRIDDEEVFNDSICNFNVYGNSYPLDAPANVTIDVYNRHLVTNDVQKTNKTHVEFDLERDDAMPPTMTFLRVLDGNGDENIWLDRMDLSTLVFACGDYGHHFNEEDFTFDHLEYNAKPEVELLYSFDGETWLPLVFAEDESLFHIDYGNVFVAYLSQLESRAINKWVSLKFVLTDEAGNTQTQELSNVFYAGENVSVNEHIAESLKHTIYPNPFTSKVKITSAQAVEGEANIAVYNVLGEQVYSKTYNCAETKEFIIDGSTWKPGVYFYSISTKDGLLQGKILKE